MMNQALAVGMFALLVLVVALVATRFLDVRSFTSIGTAYLGLAHYLGLAQMQSKPKRRNKKHGKRKRKGKHKVT